MALKDRLKEIRKDLKMNQKDFAESLGIGARTWQSYESGKLIPFSHVLIEFAVLGINLDWLITGDGDKYGVSKNVSAQKNDDPEIIRQLAAWIQEEEKRNPGALAWFRYDIRKKYPEFDRWEKREEGDSAEHNAGIKSNTA